VTAYVQYVTCDKLVHFLQLKFQNVSAKGKGFNVPNESETVPLAHKRTVPSQNNEGEKQVTTNLNLSLKRKTCTTLNPKRLLISNKARF
jgi:hypothetical protein